MKLSDILPEVSALAQVIADYWERELPKRLKDYPFIGEGEDEGPPPPEQARLKQLLASLPEERLYDLLGVAHLGCRAVRVEDWPAYRKRLPREWPLRILADALSQKVSLAYDLEDGLLKLGRDGLDVDAVATPLSGVVG